MARRSVRNVLVIAYHFPPLLGSSGLLRTLKFAKYLPEFGWHSIVVTPSIGAYENVGTEMLIDMPSTVRVHRSWALDTARHLRLFGSYPRILALPDRWVSWYASAVPVGLAAIRRYRPDVLISTYPIATAHMIGSTLARISGLPWVADFRDLMVDDHFPENAMQRKVFGSIERRTVERASRCMFTSPSALRVYAKRYRNANPEAFRLVPNGYDEDDFEGLADADRVRGDGPATMVHSGVLYPNDRNPSCFFQALKILKDGGHLSAATLRVVLRSTGHDGVYRRMLEEFGVGDLVSLAEAVPYRAALQEMVSADCLLLFQGPSCNHQIPAKLYEYLRAGPPIFALTDAAGDTAQLLRQTKGNHEIGNIDDARDIADKLLRLLKRVPGSDRSTYTAATCAPYSRRERARDVADILHELVD